MSDNTKTPLQEFEAAAVAAAAKAITGVLSREKLESLAADIVAKALEHSFGSYGNLSRQVEKQAQEELHIYLNSTDTKLAIRTEVRRAVDEKMKTIADEAKAEFTELALKSLGSAIESKRRGY